MNLIYFARKNYKADMKNNIPYIIAIVISIIIIFNVINLSYNDNMFLLSEETYKISIRSLRSTPEQPIFEEVILSGEYLQRENLFLLLVVSAFFVVYCNSNCIKRKSKEVAFLITNGARLADISRYLLYVNGINYLYASIIGVFLGIIVSPIVNRLMYFLMNREGTVFFISIEGLGMLLAYIILQVIILAMLNSGFANRREIIELMKVEKTISVHDSRRVKIPGTVYFILFLVPIAITLMGSNYAGVDEATQISAFIGSIGLYGVIKYFIPKVISILKRSKFMYKNNRRVYFSNFLYSLKNSTLYLVAMSFCINKFTYAIAKYKNMTGLISSLIFCIIALSLVFTCTFVYNLFVETTDKMYLYKQLKTMGFDKKQIFNILNFENILTYIFGLFLPLSLLICSVYNYVGGGYYSLKLGIGISLTLIVPLIIGGLISRSINKRRVFSEIYSKVGIE